MYREEIMRLFTAAPIEATPAASAVRATLLAAAFQLADVGRGADPHVAKVIDELIIELTELADVGVWALTAA